MLQFSQFSAMNGFGMCPLETEREADKTGSQLRVTTTLAGNREREGGKEEGRERGREGGREAHMMCTMAPQPLRASLSTAFRRAWEMVSNRSSGS